ncbi:MAG: hypothetical protein WAT93_01590 [Pontixanthobacter sp.]
MPFATIKIMRLVLSAALILAVLPVLPVHAQGYSSEMVDEQIRKMQSDYDQGKDWASRGLDYYDQGQYSQSCAAFRNAVQFFQASASSAKALARSNSANVNSRELYAMGEDADDMARRADYNAGGICEMAGN